jgi:hypothetical protein
VFELPYANGHFPRSETQNDEPTAPVRLLPSQVRAVVPPVGTFTGSPDADRRARNRTAGCLVTNPSDESRSS